MKSRLEDALSIRDSALAIMRTSGTKELIQNLGMCLSWEGGGLKMSFRTPFQKIPRIEDEMLLKAALLRISVENNLPYGLDIWESGKRKVYNVEWDRNGKVHICSFRRGDWEKTVFILSGQHSEGVGEDGIEENQHDH